MKSIFFILGIFIISFQSSAFIFPCGDYLLRGKYERIEGESFVIINPGSKSEYRLFVSDDELARYAPYPERWIEAKVTIDQAINGYRGRIKKTLKLESYLPDFAYKADESGLKLIQKRECHQ